jgi:hypothetical protein
MAQAPMWLLGLAMLALAGPARADPPTLEEAISGEAPSIDAGAYRASSEVLYARAGAPVILFHYFAVGPDCEARPAEVTLAEPPAHGRIAFSDGAQPPMAGERPLWGDGDPRARCAGRLVATRDATYVSDPGYAGLDHLAVTFREAGASFTDAIEVNVVKLGAPPGRRGHATRPRRKAAADSAVTSGR